MSCHVAWRRLAPRALKKEPLPSPRRRPFKRSSSVLTPNESLPLISVLSCFAKLCPPSCQFL